MTSQFYQAGLSENKKKISTSLNFCLLLKVAVGGLEEKKEEEEEVLRLKDALSLFNGHMKTRFVFCVN